MKCLCLFVAAWTATGAVAADSKNQSRPPKLGVVIVIDQMRGDYVTRFTPFFTGGLKRLLTEGAVFDSASHDHANTETAVGHATLSTGCFPKHHGIVGNEFYDREHDTVVNAVKDTTMRLVRTTRAPLKREDSLGSSPHFLMRSAIGNWLKSATPADRVFSVSLKDRAAVLSAGQILSPSDRPNGVYWWDRKTGDFVTSTAYSQSLPDWLNQFNTGPTKDTWKDSVWNRIGDTTLYNLIGVDKVAEENDGRNTTFPHAFSKEDPFASYYQALYATPFADQLLIRFARELILSENVGQGKGTDLLIVSCSAADVVGHAYGPQSQEIFDHYLRLDRCLDTLFRQLDSTVGVDNYVVALSGDHGCQELPSGRNRLSTNDYRYVVGRAIWPTLQWRSLDDVLYFIGSDLAIKRRNLDKTKIPQDWLIERDLADKLKLDQCVAYLLTAGELVGTDTTGWDIERMAKRGAFRGREPDVNVILQEHVYLTSSPTGTGHGSPYWYDRHVPLVFWGHGIKPQHLPAPVRTVDMAPTLAELLGITPPDSIDGRSLVKQILK